MSLVAAASLELMTGNDLRSPIVWWKTPRSSFWAEKVFAKAIRTNRPTNPKTARLSSGTASVAISRAEESAG